MVAIHQRSLEHIASLSDYFDADLRDIKGASPEYVLYARTAKLMEECGEVMEAVIGYTGDNPRKGVNHSLSDVTAELCDVVLTALCALHSIIGDQSIVAAEVNQRIAFVYHRIFSERNTDAPA